MLRKLRIKQVLFVTGLLIILSGAVIFLPLIHFPNNKCDSVSYYDTFEVEAMVPMSPYYSSLGISKSASRGKTVTLCLKVGAQNKGYYPVDIEFTIPNGVTLKSGSLKQKAILRKDLVFDIEVEIKEPGRYVLSGGMSGKDISTFDDSVLDALDKQVVFYESWGKGWPGSWHQATLTGKPIPRQLLPNLYSLVQWLEPDKPEDISYFTNKRELLNSKGYATYSTPRKVIFSEDKINNFMNYYHKELKGKGWSKVSGLKSLSSSNYPKEEYIYQKDNYIFIFGISFNPLQHPNEFYIKHN